MKGRTKKNAGREMGNRCLINMLEEGLLRQVFGALPFNERLMVLPRVCKLWAHILSQPSAAWTHADIDLRDLHRRDNFAGGDRPLLDTTVVSAWFCRRPDCIRRLIICDDVTRSFSPQLPMPAVLTATVLGSQRSSLQVLCLTIGVSGLNGSDFAALLVLTQLRHLKVVVRSVPFEDHGATLLRTACQLPALTDLNINSPEDGPQWITPRRDDHGLPRCRDLAELQSRSLTRLTVCMLHSVGDHTLPLARLPALRSCEITGIRVGALDIDIDDMSFPAVPQLRALTLRNVNELQLQPGSLAQLTALTAVRLIDCELHGVPADVALLSGTLSVLDVSENLELELDGAAMATILACTQLRTFGCYKPETQHYELDTLMHLVRLPMAFFKRHGR